MFHTLNTLLGSAVMERATLLTNHVIGAEPAAVARLKAHAGRRIRLHFDGWPTMLPPWPATAFQVTPAGLLEWCGSDAVEPDSSTGLAPGSYPGSSPGSSPIPDADLRVSIDASNPALGMVQALTGERPKVDVAGDAAFAADLNWLFDNLRWDVQDDLERIVGAAPAREIARVAGGVATGLRQAAQALGAAAKKTGGAGWGSTAK